MARNKTIAGETRAAAPRSSQCDAPLDIDEGVALSMERLANVTLGRMARRAEQGTANAGGLISKPLSRKMKP